MIKIEFGTEAKIEISEAFEWYEEQKSGLGEEFIQNVDRALKTILKYPKAYPKTITNYL